MFQYYKNIPKVYIIYLIIMSAYNPSIMITKVMIYFNNSKNNGYFF
jgi:hypothetical protein